MSAPAPTRCHNCGTLAAETVCHACKEPKALFLRLVQPQPDTTCCFDFAAENERALAIFYPRK